MGWTMEEDMMAKEEEDGDDGEGMPEMPTN
jgi:hypothetical protein